MNHLKHSLGWYDCNQFLLFTINPKRCTCRSKVNSVNFYLPWICLHIKFTWYICYNRHFICEIICTSWICACCFFRSFLKYNHRTVFAFVFFFTWGKVFDSTCYLALRDCLEIAVGASKGSVVANLDWVICYFFSKVCSMYRQKSSAIYRPNLRRKRCHVGPHSQHKTLCINLCVFVVYAHLVCSTVCSTEHPSDCFGCVIHWNNVNSLDTCIYIEVIIRRHLFAQH